MLTAPYRLNVPLKLLRYCDPGQDRWKEMGEKYGVDSPVYQVRCLGDTIQPAYRWGAEFSAGVFEVRVIREGERTRFRWGRSVYCKAGVRRRFGDGDVTLADAEIGAEGRGPLLPGLAELAHRRRRRGAAAATESRCCRDRIRRDTR